MMRRIYVLLLSIVSCALVLSMASPAASAHVLIRDASGVQSAVLHVNPDDDPIAGQEAFLVYDLQQNLIEPGSMASLEIAGSQRSDRLTVQPNDTLDIPVRYTFERQGTYNLTLTIISSRATYTFAHTQNVTRGAGANSAHANSYPLAEIGLVASISAFAILIIVGVRYRRDIHHKSIM